MAMNEFIAIAGSIIIPSMGIILLIFYRYKSNQKKLGLTVNYGHGVSEGSNTTYLALILTITNKGKIPIFFGGIHAIDENGELYYPSFSIKGGKKIEAGDYTTGNIPAEHLLNPRAKKLWVIDGTGKKYKLKQSVLNDALVLLREEQERLAKAGLK